MTTQAQRAANRRNAQLSTGPKTAEGKQAVSRNNFRHGLAGVFRLVSWEDPAEFDDLVSLLRAEHQPQTPTEQILVERMAQHELAPPARARRAICLLR